MATTIQPRVGRKSAERRFYSRMAIALVVIVFIGFAPSFYLRGYIPSPRPNPTLPPSVMLHGLLFTAWMAAFVVQTQLVAAGRRDIHMRLGMFAMMLALVIIPMMYLAAVWQVARANQPPFTDPLSWTIVPLAAIPAYSWLLWQGWKRRREGQWHKRLMLGAAIMVVAGPSIGRMPLLPPSLVGFSVQMLLGLGLFVPMFLWDRRSMGRIHPATRLAFSLAAAATVIPIVLIATGSWAPIARHLPGI